MASYALLCFALIAFSSQQFLANADSDLISKTCEKTLYQDICKSAFAAVPDSKNADLRGLAKIALDLAAKQANDIHAKIQDLSKTSDKATNQQLVECSENYQDAIDQFEDSEKSLESKSYFDVNTWVSSAMSDADSCEDGFKEVNVASPLTDLNKKFDSLCSIVLTITNLLDGRA